MIKRILDHLQVHTSMPGQRLLYHRRKLPVRPIDLGQFVLIEKSPNILTKALAGTMIEVFYLRPYQGKRPGEESKGLYGRFWI